MSHRGITAFVNTVLAIGAALCFGYAFGPLIGWGSLFAVLAITPAAPDP